MLNFKQLTIKKLIILYLFLITTVNAQDKIMKVGYLLNDTKNGKLNSLLADYFEKKLAPAMGVKIQWIGPLPFSRILVFLKNGELNMFYSMSKNKRREKYILYSDIPSWYDNIPMVIRKKSRLTKINKVNDLYNYKIGYCLDMIKPSFFNDPKIKVYNTSGNRWGKLNLRKLKIGRIDIALFPSRSLLNGVKKEIIDEIDFNKEFKLIYPPHEIIGKQMGKYYDGFSKANSKYFFNEYQKVIEKVGTYYDYYNKHSKSKL